MAASTQLQALNALIFLYGHVLGMPLEKVDALRIRRPALIRTALSLEDTRALLGAMEDVAGYPTRLIVRLLYGCGLRVTEPLELRVKDVDVDVAAGLPVALPGLSEGEVWCGVGVGFPDGKADRASEDGGAGAVADPRGECAAGGAAGGG